MADEKKYTRSDLQKALSADIEKVLKDLGCPSDLDHSRRVLRALVHAGAGRLLKMGAPPKLVVEQIGEALCKELTAFKKDKAGEPAPAPVALA